MTSPIYNRRSRRRPTMGIIAGQPEIIMPKMTPAQRQRHLDIARAQRASFPRRGRIPTNRYYQDIINAARERGSYRRPTYGETTGQRIIDRLNGRRSSGSGDFGFRRGGSQTAGVWAGDKSRGIPGEWDHMRGTQGQRASDRRSIGKWDGWFRDPLTPSKRGGRGRYGEGNRDMDPIPTKRKRKRKDRKKKKRRSSTKSMPISRRRFEQELNKYRRKQPRDNSRYRRDFYGQNRGDVDYSRNRRDFFGHNLRRKPRRFDFRRRVGPSNYGR